MNQIINYKLSHPNNFEDFYHGPNKDIVNEIENRLRRQQSVQAFISGDTNSGKSFILQAAVNLVADKGTSYYLNLAEFVKDSSNYEEILKLVDFNLLALDNFEVVQNNSKLQLFLFSLVDIINLRQQSLILSSCQPLRNLQLEIDDLRSRLSIYDQLILLPLSIAQISEMILNRAKKIGLTINIETSRELAKVMPAKISQIDFILKKVFEFVLQNNLKMNVDFIKKNSELFDVCDLEVNKLI